MEYTVKNTGYTYMVDLDSNPCSVISKLQDIGNVTWPSQASASLYVHEHNMPTLSS